MTLQTRAPENFRLCQWGDERTVKRAQTVSKTPIGASGNLTRAKDRYSSMFLGGGKQILKHFLTKVLTISGQGVGGFPEFVSPQILFIL